MLTLTEFELLHLARTDFLTFALWAFLELNPQTRLLLAPHHEVIAAKLEACRRGLTRRLAILLPPRQLKSHLASVAFPAWCLGHTPAMEIICASYGQDLAESFARDCRRIMMSPWYQTLFPTRLADRQAAHDFTTAAGGGRMSTSVDGVLTGRGGDLLVLDDVLKPQDALSDNQRKRVNDWFDHTLLSRLNDKVTGRIVLIMQRLHQDDLVGHVLAQEDWEVLHFPAIAEEDEVHFIEGPLGSRIYRRKAGEALHPEREPLPVLQTIRRTIGEYNFASQYQQNPIPIGGAIVRTKWLRYYTPDELPERFEQIVQSWDCANKSTELSDYSVCTTWGASDDHYFLLHVDRERRDYPDLKRRAHELAERYRVDALLIEDKASGTQLIQELKTEGIFAVEPFLPPSGTDKIMRLVLQTPLFENGRVLFPREAPWLSDYVNEIISFPGPKYDDQVDSTTQALQYLKDRSSAMAIWGRLARNAR